MNGRFGEYGGRFVSQNLVAPLRQLEDAFGRLGDDRAFQLELDGLLRDYAGRPTPLYRCRNLGSARTRLYLKREDLLHSGSQHLNLALAHGLVARRLGKTRLVAETSAGKHGIATAIVGALLRLPTRIYMGANDLARQPLNVQRMVELGADVVAVELGSRASKDALTRALCDWAESFADTHFIPSSAIGPHPFPEMARRFQSVVGAEARTQILEAEGQLPDAVIACAGGGATALGIFSGFVGDRDVSLVAVEAGGASGTTRAALLHGRPGILHGSRSLVVQDDDGRIVASHSIASGLEYPGVGPELAHLTSTGRVCAVTADDREVLEAVRTLVATEGIVPAMESAHAVAHALALVKSQRPPECLLVNLSGRGDRDLP